MTRARSLIIVAATLMYVWPALFTAAHAATADTKGKVCHSEQQCHWENFKKVCVWVKVCR
jgi:hypothetical protein